MLALQGEKKEPSVLYILMLLAWLTSIIVVYPVVFSNMKPGMLLHSVDTIVFVSVTVLSLYTGWMQAWPVLSF